MTAITINDWNTEPDFSWLAVHDVRFENLVGTPWQSTVVGGAALLERRFRDGISAGEIPSDFLVASRAIQVTDLARGLTMRAQIGTPRKTLLKDAEEAADLVLLPRRG